MKVRRFLPPTLGLAALLLIIGGVLVWKRNLLPEESKNTTTGEVFGVSRGEMTTDFPVDIPLFEPATVSSKNETRNGVQVTLETNRSQEIVENFYQEQLAKEGWKDLKEGQYQKGKGRKLEVSLAKQGADKTVIVLTYED